MRGQSPLGVNGGSQAVTGAGENHEDSVTVGIDELAVMSSAGSDHKAMMVGEKLSIPFVAQLLKDLR